MLQAIELRLVVRLNFLKRSGTGVRRDARVPYPSFSDKASIAAFARNVSLNIGARRGIARYPACMIGSNAGAMQWMRWVKRVCVLGCAAGAIAISSASCSSSSMPPRAFVAGTLEAGSAGSCVFNDTLFVDIGANETSVITGTGGVTVTCSVTPNGSNFDVSAIVQGPTSAFSFQGTLSNANPPVQSGVVVSFAGEGGVSFSSSGTPCTVDFTATPMEPSGAQTLGVAAGRIWGNVTCPMMSEAPPQMSVCTGVAEFKFEDCDG
jgi:hypothetical protein